MDGHFFDQERTIEFPVKSGWKSGNSIIIYSLSFKYCQNFIEITIGTKLTYPGEGDEQGMKLACDIVFIIREENHEHFIQSYTLKLKIKFFN